MHNEGRQGMKCKKFNGSSLQKWENDVDNNNTGIVQFKLGNVFRHHHETDTKLVLWTLKL